MYEAKAEHTYSFGTIGFKLSVDGKIDRPEALVDHMLATATAIVSIEAVQQAIGKDKRADGSQKEQCSDTLKFGDITVQIEVNFDLKSKVSLRTLNSIVFGSVLPKIWQTVAIYLGDHQLLTKPQNPLSPISHKYMLDSIDNALLDGASGLTPAALGLLQDEQESSRARHAALR